MSINDLAGKWLLKNSDQVIVLATANGTKTVEQLMAEALTTVRAISIPANTAYHIIKLSIRLSKKDLADTRSQTVMYKES